jgi:RNA 2',3'-cyclic 3'-phosphodiesterase
MTPERTEGSIRAFLAIDPPAEVRRRIGEIQSELKRAVQGKIGWVRPEGIHLTLKFFGDIAVRDVAAISEAVREKTGPAAPLDFTVHRVGVFPDLRRPRVIWLGMEGDTERLAALQRALEGAFAEIGFPAEDRPFRAHLTLGRIKTTTGLTGLAKAVADGRETGAGSFRAGGLILFRSELHPSGARYTRLAEFPFGA